MLYSEEFYKIMEMFERTAKELVRMGSMGLKREPKESWKDQIYYCDGNANQSFIIFLNGVSFGKTLSVHEHKCKYCGVHTTQPDEQCYKAPPMIEGGKD